MASDLTTTVRAGDASPPELRHGTIWRDAGYMFALVGRYLRIDPWIGPALIIVGLGGSVVIGYLAVKVAVQIGVVTDALVAGKTPAAVAALVATVLSLLALMCVQAAMFGARYIFRIRWRTVYTRQFVQRWTEANRFYHLQREHVIDNPEQRIQEDLFLVAEQLTELVPTMLTVATTLLLSISVLWGLSGPLSLTAVGLPLTVPADLLTAAILFGLLFTIGAHLVGRAITRIEIARQRLEADFRHGLGRVRENGEAIAFERGGDRERVRALGRFDLIRTNWRHYTIAQLRLLVFNLLTQSVIPRLLPIAMSAPRVLSGQMTVGQMTVVVQTFQNVLGGLTFFALYYAQVAALRASVARVRLFQLDLEQPITSQIARIERDGSVLLDGLEIRLPDGGPLLAAERIEIAKGDRVLIRGRSGAGKSTMLRAIAGLWPHGTGTIELPPADAVMFLPQRSYMPDGTFAELLTFPEMPREEDHDHYVNALNTLSLGIYADRLGEQAEWRNILSPGEQQRIAVVRALLRKPDFLFLDEATSALDVALEADLYRALTDALPDSAIVSVAHRPTVARYHTITIDVVQGRATPGPLINTSDNEEPVRG